MNFPLVHTHPYRQPSANKPSSYHFCKYLYEETVLEITGIPVVPNDSPALLVKEMSEIMGVNLNENDISIAHRLPPTKKVKDRLIVKFTQREKRDEIYSKRKNLKS